VSGVLASVVGLAQQSAHDFSMVTTEHHAEATGGPLEAVLVAVGVLIVIVVIVMTIKYFVRPGEVGPDHIKRRILRDELWDEPKVGAK